MATRFVLWFWRLLLMTRIAAAGDMYSSRLIHRFSDELRAFSGEKFWPELRSKEYYRMLLTRDFRRLKMKFGHQRQNELLFPSKGSQTLSFGNELAWLHYTWIDIGTPNVSFLVALDDGSDLLWVPCDCVQCAPLSARYYASLDKDLNEYSPDSSSTSNHLPCSHQLCELGPNCQSPAQTCPYDAQYYSVNTSSSGMLVEDILHLSSSSNSPSNASVQALVVFGCGKKQSGGYLDGVAPDGVMGLGLGEISVPSLLAKAGLIQNTFSLCFNEDDSGRIFFGDQGLNIHHWTPLLPLDGKYSTYVVGVDAFYIGKSYLKQTSFHALIDSGTSFSFLPDDVYPKVVQKFDSEVNASRGSYGDWDYCYTSSTEEPLHFPSVELRLQSNESFVIQNPIFSISGDQGIVIYCLPIQPTDGNIAIIGQNFMTGYHMVFDRENMKLGWSLSDCEDLSNGKSMAPTSGKAPNPLPTDEQQRMPGRPAVAPAIAGRAPPTSSNASTIHIAPFWPLLSTLLCLLTSFLLLGLMDPEVRLIIRSVLM